MRLRLSRRATGSTTAHNSRYGPSDSPRITSDQRDAVYRQILDHMGNAGDLSLLVEHGDLSAARRLAREVSDDLQLILDALGWGETSSDGYVELDLPAGQLRRTFSRLHERAVEDREVEPQAQTDTQAPHERALIVIETCEAVLAVVGDDTAAAG